jgi:hypothetical protein
MYFLFIITSEFAGLALATVLRVELSMPGVSFLSNNSEKYLTTAAVHAIVMVFYVVIPVLFGAFGNFLLPTQLGVRDVAFPRLNSFMFWVTPSGFVLLLHIFLFDKTPSIPFESSSCARPSTKSSRLYSLQSDHGTSFVGTHGVAQTSRELNDVLANSLIYSQQALVSLQRSCLANLHGL